MGIFLGDFRAEYGNHKIRMFDKAGLVTIEYRLYIDDKLIDSIKSTPIIQIGKYELHGVIQEDGIDKPVLVKITQTLYSTMYKLFINNHQIPIRRWK
ncbi:MAG: hypothetical protein PUJ82_16810 [Spirochaetales bacterium]|nr:hypothetical protein [Treponema sp.]MDD7612566.1 hypothetical protein [Spirochaetales bacterium]MDY5916669.1 hypothetical protein [Treponema sp.]